MSHYFVCLFPQTQWMILRLVSLPSFKKKIFFLLQSSIEVEITKCGVVEMEKAVFNKLRSAYFKDIGKLVLAEGTFEFLGSTSRHGPVTIVSIYTRSI